MQNFTGRPAWCAVGVLAITLLGGFTWAPGLAFSAWTIGKPIVTYYQGPPPTAAAPQMAAGGWNLVWADSLAELNAAQASGLRAMWTGPLDNATVNSIKNHPALYSYWVADEPKSDWFPEFANTVSNLRTLDPNHMAYINLYPTYASSAQLGTSGYDYPTYLSQYINTVHPSLLSYDHYSFFTTSDGSQWFKNLAIISHTAKVAGIPFMNIVQSSSWSSGVRVPTGNELRFEYYTSLAYGAQGISDFVYYSPTKTGGMALANGTTTTLYDMAKTINPQFVAIAQQLQSMDHIATYHLGDLPPGYGTTDGSSPMRLPGNSPFKLTPDITNTNYVSGNPVRGAVLGLFGPDDQLADATLTLAVNLNYSSALNTRVTGPGNLSVFDPATGTWIAQGHSWADVSLLPGGGVLVGLTSAIPVAGDYNNDSVVDAADYVLWRKGLSPDPSQAGYDLWRQNFGKVAGVGSVVAAVPEPTGLVLVLAAIGASVMGVGRRRACGRSRVLFVRAFGPAFPAFGAGRVSDTPAANRSFHTLPAVPASGSRQEGEEDRPANFALD